MSLERATDVYLISNSMVEHREGEHESNDKVGSTADFSSSLCSVGIVSKIESAKFICIGRIRLTIAWHWTGILVVYSAAVKIEPSHCSGPCSD